MFKHYLTTLAGLAAAALNLYANGAHPAQIGLSLGIAALGAVAKDSNKQ